MPLVGGQLPLEAQQLQRVAQQLQCLNHAPVADLVPVPAAGLTATLSTASFTDRRWLLDTSLCGPRTWTVCNRGTSPAHSTPGRPAGCCALGAPAPRLGPCPPVCTVCNCPSHVYVTSAQCCLPPLSPTSLKVKQTHALSHRQTNEQLKHTLG